jgi:hypothetical protein
MVSPAKGLDGIDADADQRAALLAFAHNLDCLKRLRAAQQYKPLRNNA